MKLKRVLIGGYLPLDLAIIIITTIAFTVIIIGTETAKSKSKTLKDKEYVEKIQALEASISNDRIVIERCNEEIQDLMNENNHLELLSRINSCGVCGKHNIDYGEDEKSVWLQCKDCYTRVDFDKKYSVSDDHIIKTWNGLKFKMGTPFD
jgi:hypothetical protein